MPCHWESSQRPLFVKTVWKNGYRHAILTKEDPAFKKISPRDTNIQNFWNLERHKRPKSSSNKKEEHLKVPAVQLLLANTKKIRKSDTKMKTAPSKRDKLQKSLTFDVILREDIKITSKTTLLGKEPKSFEEETPERTIFLSDRLHQNSKSLTERVLLWLDLAGRHPPKSGTPPSKKFPERQKSFQEYPLSIEDCQISKNIELVTTQIENRFDADFSILRNQGFEPSRIELEFNSKDEYRLANVEGDNVLIKKDILESNFIQNQVPSKPILKRKVHIFIPNIGNKNLDTGSECSNSILSIDSKK